MATITDLKSTDNGSDSMNIINTNFDNLNTELATALQADGSVVPSANLPMNSKKLTGLAAGSQNGDSVCYEQVLLLTGGTMSGDIDMNNNDINNVGSISPDTFSIGNATTTVVDILDEDDMASDSDVKLATQQSIKAYVDNYHAVGCRAYANSSQNIPSGTWTKVQFNVKSYDIGGNFNTTNYRFTAPVAGYYQVNTSVMILYGTVNATQFTGIYKNGSRYSQSRGQAIIDNNRIGLPVNDIVYLDVNDYIEIYVYQNSGETRSTDVGADKTFVSIFLLHRA